MLRLVSLVAFVIAGAEPAMAEDQPAGKHALWETTTTFEGMGTPAQTFRHCTDEDADALITRMNQLIVGARQEKCPPADVQKTGDTTVVNSICKIGASTITSRGTITTGDGAYTIKFIAKWEGGPPIPGMPAAGTSNMTIEAKRLGECKGEQEDGDSAPKR
jgi:Protein of unknown function (DUF3617)